jgi:hypothetical protein
MRVKSLFGLFGIFSALLLLTASWYGSKFSGFHAAAPASMASPAPSPAMLKMQKKAVTARKFAARNNFNKKICFLADMSLASGTNRFFIYDMEADSVLDAGLVTHGRCNKPWLEGRKYSNVVGSGCTSPGKYKIGKSYSGTFGLAYKLHGLDSSNSNAYKRYVVLHGHECVPDKEVDPQPICQSDGCPTLSAAYLKKVSSIINASDKPMLLWIYE